jgi:hypothetical protein
MKTTVSKSDFIRAFELADRAGVGNNFSYEALGLLFDYFEQYEEDIGEEIELDVIAICCEFYEETAASIASNHSIDVEGLDGICTASAYGLEQHEKALRDVVREYLADNTNLIGETATGFVYAAF